ncbi:MULTISPECIES: PAS domain-containing protein [Calothrix]|uniref:histidine kinase n=2 Tax=Calothrix TaxID=1186 RepID=A0ABR8AI80_9CYAN|nr:MULTISPECIES: PAS domain-containing protein [Calothrix]MBD2199449.1 PAS domain-containing protein [Calothrix parietina FACHB-288]MBD2228263.1 PAS domain-containing protein [Calothrix anomala FACHB-343]
MNQQLRTVLIVDDSPEDRELYLRYLRRDGTYNYNFVHAELARIGLELWQQHQPDIVLLDYFLPDLDGRDFLRQLQTITGQLFLPVIVVTGQGNEAIAAQAIKAGAQDYLVKGSMTADGLCLAVNAAIENIQLRNQLQQALQQVQDELAERKRTEKILQENEERLRLALEAAHMGTWDWNITTGKIQWSSNLEALFGLKPGEFDGSYTMFVSRLHPDDRDRVLEAINAAIATGANYNIEFRVVYPNGDIRWALSQGKVFYDETGNPVRMAGVDLDITERKRSEAELQQTNAWLKLAQKATSSGLWDWNLTTGKIRIGEEFCRLIAIDPAIREISYEDWLLLIHPEDRIKVNEYISRLIRDQQQDYDTEFRLLHPQSDRWLASRAKVFYDETGKAVRMTGNIQDINARKLAEENLRESERRYANLAQAVPVAIFRFDNHNNCVYVNDRWSEISGRPKEAAFGSGWIDSLHPQDRDRIVTAWAQALASGGMYQQEGRCLRPDGSITWFYCQVLPETDPNGSITGYIGTLTDITDRKQAEEQIRLQAQVLAQTHDSVISTDLDGYITSWNQGAERVFGYSAQEAIGQHLRLMYRQPEMLDFLETQVIAPLKIKGEHELEVTVPRKSGELITVLLSLSLLRDENQRPVGMIGLSMDITARKLAEAALRENEQLLRLALSGAKAGSWDWEIQTNQINWSPENYDLYGLDPNKAQVEYADWYNTLHPEDKERTHAEVMQVVEQKLPEYQSEFRIVHPQKGICWLLALGRVTFDRHGEPLRLSGINLDISDRKRAEEELRQSEEFKQRMLASSSDCIKVLDLDGKLLYMNPGGICLLEIDDFTPLLHSEWCCFWPEEARNIAEDALAMAKLGELGRFQGYCPTAKGKPKWWDVVLTPIRNSAGQVVQILCISRDITDDKNLEIERDRILQLEQEARNEAEKANRIKDEFLAVLSHELRSPLNPILGWTKLLQSGKLDEAKTTEALATIERNAKLQTQLIDDLLDIARILRGKLSLNAEPVNLAYVIEAAIETVRTAAVAKSIVIHPLLPNIGQVSGDAVRLQQIIWNLLSNAIKFTPSGGRVDIWLEKVGKQAQITVADTGKGINPEFLPYIFESFRQEDVSVTRKYGGLGLGLAIVRHLIAAHGGTVSADSLGEGHGAIFTVKLPLLHVESESDRPEELPADILDLTGIKVLTIDDEADSRDFIEFLLAEYGAEVMTVASSGEFLTAIASFQPDIIVSDIGMPEVDGYTLMRQVRKLEAEKGGTIPAIALTAYAGEINQQQALAAGFQRHLSKPIDPDLLILAIAQLLREQ